MRDGEETGFLRFLSRIPGGSLLRVVCENPIAFANAERLFLNRVPTSQATRP